MCKMDFEPLRVHAETEGATEYTASSKTPLCCTLPSTRSLGFTLPYLGGSKPLHSFVPSVQGVESDQR
ncbi:hypothetical protein ALPO108162_03515 [Alicyclobacillus pomorum]